MGRYEVMVSLVGQKPHCLGPRPAWAKEGFVLMAGKGVLCRGHQLAGLLP